MAQSRSDVTTRVFTALALIPIVAIIYFGGPLAILLCLAIAAVMASEVLGVSQVKAASLRGVLTYLIVLIPAATLAINAVVMPIGVAPNYVLMAAVIAGFITMTTLVARLVLIFLTLCIYSLISILLMETGVLWLMLAVAAVVAADSAAYFGGRRFGGPKLAPMISPSKTWSGACFGVTGGAIAGFAVGSLLGIEPNLSALMGLFIADLSIGGDLLESWFKRKYGVKDSGNILPGHGGFLDRFDGFLLVLPFVFGVLHFGGING